MASFGDRQAVREAVDFIESHFPNAGAHSHPTLSPACADSHASQNLFAPPGIPADEYHRGIVEGPPPGLVRVRSPTFTPTRVFNNENTSLFSDFARYIDKGVDENLNPVQLDLTCVICHDSKLQVPDSLTPDYHWSKEQSIEWLAVLPCGHFYGADCLERWFLTSALESEDGVTRCPLCRFKVMYQCGHYIPPREYNPELFRAEQVPLTLPEGGAVPHSCEVCYKGNVDGAIDRLRDLLFPRVLPGDLRFVDSAEVMRSSSTEFEKRVWDFWGINAQYNRW
ncbi:hypothetical protein F5Y12DRAFT_794106 [Xylaria sp. FL1777]|nr:hypothetical protein F5Y12DRAFT_794106 [Xylaria sp. FL1777]